MSAFFCDEATDKQPSLGQVPGYGAVAQGERSVCLGCGTLQAREEKGAQKKTSVLHQIKNTTTT